MKALDLFSGAGGAAMGLYRAGFTDITGVDIRPQKHYPFRFIQADAMTFPLEGYDFIWASPPCQAYVQRNKNLVTKHPKLIEPVRARLEAAGVPFIIENVLGQPLQATVMLCGTMFGLKVIRHRYFYTSFPASLAPATCTHEGSVSEGDYAAVYAFGGKGPRFMVDGERLRVAAPTQPGPSWDEAMGIDWMDKKGLSQAIPPAYSEWLGKQVLQYLQVKA